MSASPADVAAVAMLAERFGVTVADLAAAATPRAPMPTFAEYIPRVHDAMPEGGTRDHYMTYWKKILAEEGWGARRLDEPTTAQLAQLVETIRLARIVRRTDQNGSEAARHVVCALRRLYKHAERERLIDPRDNPAAQLDKPGNRGPARHALPTGILADLLRVAATTGNDPELDKLLLRLHIETACRRGGALALRPQDLEPVQSVILLREKGGTRHWQPVSPTLMRALCRHAEERGAAPTQQLLRARNGKPITHRRYDGLFTRLGKHLPWVITRNISAHWLRHTTITWVERTFGKAVASAFARHRQGRQGTTSIYTTATINEVAWAVAVLTGEPHPLATEDSALDWFRNGHPSQPSGKDDTP